MGPSSEVRAGGPDEPAPRLSVAAVARRLGVAPSTLRTWDRRYGLGPSSHQAGAHRRYTPEDLDRLVVMRRLTLEGVPPAEAARTALAAPAPRPVRTSLPAPPATPPVTIGRPSPTGPRVPPGAVGLPICDPPPRRRTVLPAAGPPPIPAARDGGSLPSARLRPPAGGSASGPSAEDGIAPDRTALDRTGPDRTGLDRTGLDGAAPDGIAPDAVARDTTGAAGTAGRTTGTAGTGAQRSRAAAGPVGDGRCGGGKVLALPDAPQARGLARAAMALDSPEMARILGEAIAADGVVGTWDRLAVPVLQAVGRRWAVTGQGVDVEHLFTQVLEDALRMVVASRRPPRRPSPVLLGCVENDHHALPLHALAAALAERGTSCRVLGAGMPATALVTAVRRTGPALVFLYARLPVDDASALTTLPRQRPAPRLVLGGPGWGERHPAATRMVSSLAEAAETVGALLRG